MKNHSTASKRKYLKTIFDIQKSFGSRFENISRNFSFGLKPTEIESNKLEVWFSQVNEVKSELYREIYRAFQLKPSVYLGASFDYETFFKGRDSLARIKLKSNLITSVPVIEGLRMEITGSIRSYITNHRRIFDDNISELINVKNIIIENRVKLESIGFEAEKIILEALEKLQEKEYEDIVSSYKLLVDYENMLFAFNESVAEYNYEANQLNTSQKLRLSLLDKLSRLPAFPGITEKEQYELDGILEQLTGLSSKEMEDIAIISFLQKAKKRIERKATNKRKRFEDRLSAFLHKKYNSDFSNQKKIVSEFSASLNVQITKLKNHFEHKRYDGAGRNKYFELLAFKAKLVQPEINIEINTTLSKAKSFFLQGKTQREIITIPGFSWDKDTRGKPNKHVAFAIEDNKLYICIASSRRAFINIGESGDLNFVKTTGGQKKKNSTPKTIEYVRGDFQQEIEQDVPLKLALHFGKSYARRYLFNKQWGLFSKNPQIFLNNARIKREKVNSGDHWRYYFDVSMSGEKVFGYKDFAGDILAKAESVIGIDRGEVNPIAYTVIDLQKVDVLEKGFLAQAYIEQLKKYDATKRDYQSKGRIIPKYLKSKVIRLQETLLETAASEILALVAKYNGVVVLEDLHERFKGAERSLIPKKTYKKVEGLLADSLQFAGLLRIDTNGGYWGALKTVYPAGTSQTCLQCGQVWKKDFKDEILIYSKNNDYQNIDFDKKILKFDAKTVFLHEAFSVFNSEIKHTEMKTLADLEKVIRQNEVGEILRYLKRAIEPRITQEIFVCGLCRFKENADIVGSTNIGKRGINLVQKLLLR